MTRPGLASVLLVNWNSGTLLADCLRRLAEQTYAHLEIIIVDNASTDGSLDVDVGWAPGPPPDAREGPCYAGSPIRIIRNAENFGFSRALNQGFAVAAGEYILSLNADVWLQSDFIARLVETLAAAPSAGMACGKLFAGDGPADGRRLDSTGLFLSATRRPYDRGQGEEDRGQYDDQTDVFGACGASWLCRRAMLDDVACAGEILDEDFFVYYDDADLSWRAQLRGWGCRYQPAAQGWHARGGGDTLRKAFSAPKRAFAQAHALKNRYLMLLKNDDWANLWPALPALLAGDLARLGYVALRRPALLRAYADAWRLRRRALEKRRIIQAGRRVSVAKMRRWLR
jgi:GT2 family glycosyltransferase